MFAPNQAFKLLHTALKSQLLLLGSDKKVCLIVQSLFQFLLLHGLSAKNFMLFFDLFFHHFILLPQEPLLVD